MWHNRIKAMLTIRPAQLADLKALCHIRYAQQPAIHRDRINAANNTAYYYLVAERDSTIVGFGMLLVERPPGWNDPLNAFPIIVDLFVAEAYRGQGFGSALLAHIESTAYQHGKRAIYLNVEPHTNPRALALYQRLGFQPLQAEPYHHTWRFTDSQGVEHFGEEWVVDMCKPLGT
jgi:GNAT superfamily N-acetyltransferase